MTPNVKKAKMTMRLNKVAMMTTYTTIINLILEMLIVRLNRLPHH